MKKSDPPIFIEKSYASSPEQIWKALTDLAEMKQWYFEMLSEFEAKVGFQTSFSLENEGRAFTHQWEIVEVIPQKLLKYRWNYTEYPGDSYVSFSLEPEGAETKLRLETVVVEDFPDQIPEFKRESGVAGWEYLLGESLRKYLESAK